MMDHGKSLSICGIRALSSRQSNHYTTNRPEFTAFGGYKGAGMPAISKGFK